MINFHSGKTVEAAKAAIRSSRPPWGARRAGRGALRAAQASHDALAAQRLVQDVLLSSMARMTDSQDVKA